MSKLRMNALREMNEKEVKINGSDLLKRSHERLENLSWLGI